MDNRVKFGSTFLAQYQELDVNVDAEPVKEDGWSKELREFTVSFGEKWYYGKLGKKREFGKRKEGSKEEKESPVYLIRDDVGGDGWGTITIFKNIQWVKDEIPNVIPTMEDPVRW